MSHPHPDVATAAVPCAVPAAKSDPPPEPAASERPLPDRAKIDRWNRILAPYRSPDTVRSVAQLVITTACFLALWYAAYRALAVGYWLTLLLAIPTAGFMMKLFIIQHDCGHGSFFRSRKARDWVGRVIGVVLLTPYDYWKKTHAYHHAHSGDLDFRGMGDVDTFTVAEYLSWPRSKRLKYRLYRNPIVLFGIGPIWQFLIKHRFPLDAPRTWTIAWRSIWWTNVAIAVAVLACALAVGIGPFLLVHAPVTMLATAAGVWMFYVQHQFEHTYWDRHEAWDYYDASLHGASYLVLPRPLDWLTGSIGVHHVHHMSPRIPNYRLRRAHEENPEFHEVTIVRPSDTIGLVRRALWDEEERRLVTFGEVRRKMRSGG